MGKGMSGYFHNTVGSKLKHDPLKIGGYDAEGSDLFKGKKANRKNEYNDIIDQFNVDENYQKDAYGTYCNYFVRDVAEAMGIELEGGAGAIIRKLAEMAADESSAWIEVDAKMAQEWANNGHLTIGGWLNPSGGDNHVQIIRPETDTVTYKTRTIDGVEYGNPVAAQAGITNYNIGHVGDGYSKDKHPDVKYYAYTE